MNLLAHSLLAAVSLADTGGMEITASLMADYFTGQDHGNYPLPVARGILHHRMIDSFTDRHEEFRIARHLIAAKGAPRFSAGILLDIFWDHVLASGWDEFARPLCGLGLDAFGAKVNQAVMANRRYWSPVFARVAPWLVSQYWLSGYRSIEGVQRTLEGLSTRIRHGQGLADCHRLFTSLEEPLSQGFRRFWPCVVQAAREGGRKLEILPESTDGSGPGYRVGPG